MTGSQTRRLLVPSPGDYWAMDLTLDEERQRLRYEYRSWSYAALDNALHDNAVDFEAAFDGRPFLTHEEMVERLIDTVCPRAWLDRRLQEEPS